MRHAAARLGVLVRAVRGTVDELFPRAIDVSAAGERHEPFEADAAGSYCGRCGATSGPGASDAGGCAFCRDTRLAWDAVTRLRAYVPPLDEHIREMKFGRQWRWAPELGVRLARALPAMAETPVIVVPVPMSWQRRWVRGYNQAELMARALAAARGWPVALVLRRTRHTSPQTAVAFSDRPHNVANSFAIDAVDLGGRAVVLVDDVKTSGSTLAACARLLRQAKAQRIHVAVAAVADPKGGDFSRIDA